MKNWFIVFLASLVMVSFISCVSLHDLEMNTNEMAVAQVLGRVEVEFTSFQFLHAPGKGLKQKAYIELRRAAQRRYGDNIEIRNIDITGGFSPWEAVMLGVPAVLTGICLYALDDLDGFLISPIFGVNIFGNFQKITATADV